MKTNIVTIGNSQGFRIPKILLEQSKLSGDFELQVRSESIVILPIRKPRVKCRIAVIFPAVIFALLFVGRRLIFKRAKVYFAADDARETRSAPIGR